MYKPKTQSPISMVQRFSVFHFRNILFFFIYNNSNNNDDVNIKKQSAVIETDFPGYALMGHTKSEGRTFEIRSVVDTLKKYFPSLIYYSKQIKASILFVYPQYPHHFFCVFLCYKSDPLLNETRYRQEIGIKNTHRHRNVFIKNHCRFILLTFAGPLRQVVLRSLRCILLLMHTHTMQMPQPKYFQQI